MSTGYGKLHQHLEQGNAQSMATIATIIASLLSPREAPGYRAEPLWK